MDVPMTWAEPQLAVIVPSYNERDNVGSLYEKVKTALAGIPFEFIVVDDDSPDGTAGVVRDMARRFPEVRCIHRIGRRGLTSAVVEGVLVSSAPFFAVIDADHQHDETALPLMYAEALRGAEIVAGTRYAGGGSVGTGLSSVREKGSRFATQLSSIVTGKAMSDPMSGFFLMRRDVFDDVVPTISKDGFKILLDIVVSATRFKRHAGGNLRLAEVPYVFRPRHAGESKMSSVIAVQFLGLVLSKLTGGILPATFLLFALVGGSGVVVHLTTLWLTHERLGWSFAASQIAATAVAMTTNFVLNNELTFRDRKLRGLRFLRGLLTFYAICSIGAIANVSVATFVYQDLPGLTFGGISHPEVYVAGIAGALMSIVFNYSVTKVFTWR